MAGGRGKVKGGQRKMESEEEKEVKARRWKRSVEWRIATCLPCPWHGTWGTMVSQEETRSLLFLIMDWQMCT
jgi:hypothetical protein